MKKKNREISETLNDDDMFKFYDPSSIGSIFIFILKPPNTNNPILESQMMSLKTKGFLRAYQEYKPSVDVTERFLSLSSAVLKRSVTESNLENVKFADSVEKLKLLLELEKEFCHSIPNSMLHEMSDLKLVHAFYSTPISVNTPYEQLHKDSQDGNLPSNLVIQLEPIRFTGKGDHRLDQVSAFPRRETVVTGLKTRKKFNNVVPDYSKYQEEDYN